MEMATMNVDKQAWKIKRGSVVFLVFLFCIAGMLTACGRETEAEERGPEIIPIPIESGENPEEDGASGRVGASSVSEAGMDSVTGEIIPDSKAPESEGAETPGADSQTAGTSQPVDPDAAAPEMDAMQLMFGRDCISEQTFEVQLSEYDQKVYFVPFAPSQENPQFRIQLIQNGQVLKELSTYVPDELAEEEFSSLDAVSFYDINFDGNTDILLLETYGDTRFAAVYYGDSWISYVGDTYVGFYIQEEMSEYLYEQINPLTCSEISDFLTGGKENGEFASYQEAYAAMSRVYDLGGERREFNLIYFDEDDIPELVAGVSGYWMSLYTYSEGTVYCLANDWGYGAFGNMGYEYVPGKNSLRNIDTDNAGQIVNITYMTINPEHSMEEVVWIKLVFSEEMNEDMEYDCTTYVNGEEVAEDEIGDYDVGEYEYIDTILSLQELLEKLGH